MIKIYSLTDPITFEIRYIGQTSKQLHRRLASHVCDKTKSHKVNWIKSLNGLKPIINLIQEVPNEEFQKWEVFYIKFFRDCGFNLTNTTDGGENDSKGFLGMKHTPEWKDNARNRSKGNKSRIGMPHSEETKQKISSSQIGKKLSEETKQKISSSHIGKKMSDEFKEECRQRTFSRKRNSKGQF